MRDVEGVKKVRNLWSLDFRLWVNAQRSFMDSGGTN